MFIKCFAAIDFCGQPDFYIDFKNWNSEDPCKVLIAPNGFGKTTMMNIIRDVASLLPIIVNEPLAMNELRRVRQDFSSFKRPFGKIGLFLGEFLGYDTVLLSLEKNPFKANTVTLFIKQWTYVAKYESFFKEDDGLPNLAAVEIDCDKRELSIPGFGSMCTEREFGRIDNFGVFPCSLDRVCGQVKRKKGKRVEQIDIYGELLDKNLRYIASLLRGKKRQDLSDENIIRCILSGDVTYRSKPTKWHLSIYDFQYKYDILLKMMTRLLTVPGSAKKTITFDPTKRAFFVVSDGYSYPISEMSSGELNYFATMFTLLFGTNPKCCENNTDLVIIDEPELSLHIEWQRRIVGDILRSISTRGLNSERKNKIQVIVITHSPFVVDGHEERIVTPTYYERECNE